MFTSEATELFVDVEMEHIEDFPHDIYALVSTARRSCIGALAREHQSQCYF